MNTKYLFSLYKSDPNKDKTELNYLEWYWITIESASPYYSREFGDFFLTIVGNQNLLNINYNFDKFADQQFSLNELVNGISKLKKERDKLLLETQKYLPSKYLTSLEFLHVINNTYNKTIMYIEDIIRVLKIENPEIDVDEEIVDFNNPRDIIYNYFRGLTARSIEVRSESRFSNKIQNMLGENYDRFTGETLESVLELLKYYQEKITIYDGVSDDEVILSNLLKLDKDEPELNNYLSRIRDNNQNLLLDIKNFKDLYTLVKTIKEEPIEDDFNMDLFENYYDTITNVVFSDKINHISPRLIKLLVTLFI